MALALSHVGGHLFTPHGLSSLLIELELTSDFGMCEQPCLKSLYLTCRLTF